MLLFVEMWNRQSPFCSNQAQPLNIKAQVQLYKCSKFMAENVGRKSRLGDSTGIVYIMFQVPVAWRFATAMLAHSALHMGWVSHISFSFQSLESEGQFEVGGWGGSSSVALWNKHLFVFAPRQHWICSMRILCRCPKDILQLKVARPP